MSATSTAAAASTQPLLVSTIVSIGTPASAAILKAFMEVEVTRSMTCADLYTSATASRSMFPKLEDLDPRCYVGLTKNEWDPVELSEPLYGFVRVSKMDVTRDILMVCYQRRPIQAMLAAGISVEQQQSMSNDEAARWLQERARSLKRKKSRAADTSSSTPTPLSSPGFSASRSVTPRQLGFVNSPTFKRHASSPAGLFLPTPASSQSTESTRATSVFDSPVRGTMASAAPTGFVPAADYWHDLESPADKVLPGMAQLGEDLQTVFRDGGYIFADDDEGRAVGQFTFSSLAAAAWALDAAGRLKSTTSPHLFVGLVKLADARRSGMPSRDSTTTADLLSSPLFTQTESEIARVFADSAADGDVDSDSDADDDDSGYSGSLVSPRSPPRRRTKYYTNLAASRTNINTACFLDLLATRLDANMVTLIHYCTFNPDSKVLFSGLDPRTSATKCEQLLQAVITVRISIEQQQLERTKNLNRAGTYSDTGSDSCIIGEWVQEAGQIGKQMRTNTSDNGNGNGSNHKNSNRINIDTLLEVSRKKKIPVFADPLLPQRTRNLSQYNHGYEYCMIASTRFVVFVVHKKPATKRVLIAPLDNDSPDALKRLRRSAEQVYTFVRRLELGDQRVRNVCFRVLDILQSGSGLTIDIMDTIKAAGITPPPSSETCFANTIKKLIEKYVTYDDLEYARMFANVLNIAVFINNEVGTERGMDRSVMEETGSSADWNDGTPASRRSDYMEFYSLAGTVLASQNAVYAPADRVSVPRFDSTIASLYRSTVTLCSKQHPEVLIPHQNSFRYQFLPPDSRTYAAGKYTSRFPYRPGRIDRDLHPDHPRKGEAITTINTTKALIIQLNRNHGGYCYFLSSDDKARIVLAGPNHAGIALARTKPGLKLRLDKSNTGTAANSGHSMRAASHDYSCGAALIPSLTAFCKIPTQFPGHFKPLYHFYSVNDGTFNGSTFAGHCTLDLSTIMAVIKAGCVCGGGYGGEACGPTCSASTDIEKKVDSLVGRRCSRDTAISATHLLYFYQSFEKDGNSVRPSNWPPFSDAIDFAQSPERDNRGRCVVGSVDGGSDRNGKHGRNRVSLLAFFSMGDFDYVAIIRNCSGRSAFNEVERSMSMFSGKLRSYVGVLDSLQFHNLALELDRCNNVGQLREALVKFAEKLAKEAANKLIAEEIVSGVDAIMEKWAKDVVAEEKVDQDSDNGNEEEEEDGGINVEDIDAAKANSYDYRNDPGLFAHIEAEVKLATDKRKSGDFAPGTPEAEAYSTVFDQYQQMINAAAAKVVEHFAQVGNAANVGPRNYGDSLRLLLLFLARCGIEKPKVEMLDRLYKWRNDNDLRPVYAAMDAHVRCAEFITQIKRCDNSACLVCGGPRDGDHSVFVPAALITTEQSRDIDPDELAAKAIADPQWARENAGVSPLKKPSLLSASQKRVTKGSNSNNNNRSNSSNNAGQVCTSPYIRAFITCSKCEKPRGLYISHDNMPSDTPRRAPVEEKYGPHVQKALSANQKWSCGEKLNSPTAYVNLTVRCDSLIEIAVLRFIWKHNEKIGSNAASTGGKSNSSRITAPCYFCGKTPANNKYFQSLQFDSPDGDKYPFCTLECHVRCNNDGISTGRASSTRRAAKPTSAKRKTNASNTSAASSQLSAATATTALSQPLSLSQLDGISLSQPTQSLTPAAADMVDISLSDDESLAAAVKEDFDPNQELGDDERLSNLFVDDYGRHLLCSVKTRQPYWITTNFSTRLFSDNGSNEFATLSRKSWTPDSDLYLIPILADEHWTMVAADVTEMTMYYFDSFNGKHTTVEGVRGSRNKFERVLTKMFTSGMPGVEKLAGINSDEDGERQFLIGEPTHTERGFEWEKHGWTFVVLQLESRQMNTYDCGVFMLAFAKSQVLSEKYNATQEQMAGIRRILSREMRNKRLEPSLVDINN